MRLLQQGGQVLPYVHYTTPHPKRQALLAALAADVAAHTAVVAAPAVVAKTILSAPTPGAGVGAPVAVAAVPAAVAKTAGAVVGVPAPVAKKAKALVAREAKASKECSPETADVATPVEVVTMPAPVAKAKAHNESAPGPFHPTVIVVEILGTEIGDQGHSCEEHASNCGKVMAKDMVVCLQKVQIQCEGWEEMAITAYWVMGGVNCCHVGFLPCHMVRHATCYSKALAQVTRIFNVDSTCCNTAERHTFNKNIGYCLAAIIAW